MQSRHWHQKNEEKCHWFITTHLKHFSGADDDHDVAASHQRHGIPISLIHHSQRIYNNSTTRRFRRAKLIVSKSRDRRNNRGGGALLLASLLQRYGSNTRPYYASPDIPTFVRGSFVVCPCSDTINIRQIASHGSQCRLYQAESRLFGRPRCSTGTSTTVGETRD